MRLWLIAAFVAGVLSAQDQPPAPPPPPPGPPTLEFNGKPVVVPYQCTEEDMRVAGLACTDDDPCPVYLELSTAASTGLRVYAAGNIHTAAATLYSVILGSDDNGHTWREVYERLRSSSLDGLDFVGTDNGWASGIEISPLPQDPFILKTIDGGKTWQRIPMFEETRYGTIQQFQFEDASTGALILDHGAGSGADRYERYESRDGGGSWTVKETSGKALTLKRPANAAQPEWRVRAEGNSRSFHVEHRQGTRWSSVAQFAVNVGSCRPPQ